MARRKQTDSKPPKRRSTRHRESPEPSPTPDISDRSWKLRRATREVWGCLDNVTTVADLKAFWLSRRADSDTREIKVEFPKFVKHTWDFMRNLSDEMGVGIPPEPKIGRYGILLQAYYDGANIPVDEVLLRTTIDQIVAWCRKAASSAKHRLRQTPTEDDVGKGKKPPKATVAARMVDLIRTQLHTHGLVESSQ